MLTEEGEHPLEARSVLIDATSAKLTDANVVAKAGLEATTLVIPCASIVQRLRASLTSAEVEDAQTHLKFPPSIVVNRAGRR